MGRKADQQYSDMGAHSRFFELRDRRQTIFTIFTRSSILIFNGED